MVSASTLKLAEASLIEHLPGSHFFPPTFGVPGVLLDKPAVEFAPSHTWLPGKPKLWTYGHTYGYRGKYAGLGRSMLKFLRVKCHVMRFEAYFQTVLGKGEYK